MELTPYESQQYEEIRAWQAEPPSVAAKVFGTVAAPAAWLLQRIIPEAALRGAIEASCKAGSTLANQSDVLKSCNVNSIDELRRAKLEVCDSAANEAHDWAIGIAIAQGGIEGAAGLPGLAAGIPATITLAFRTVHQIGLCYGYVCTSELDMQFVCGVLVASGANSMRQKVAALTMLRTLYVILARQTWKAIGEKAAQQVLGREAGIMAVKNLARQLGINLTKRKALQAIPVVGAGVGAAVKWLVHQGCGVGRSPSLPGTVADRERQALR